MGNKLATNNNLISSGPIPKALRIKGYTWKKHSIGLFDYSFTDINTDNIEIIDPRC